MCPGDFHKQRADSSTQALAQARHQLRALHATEEDLRDETERIRESRVVAEATLQRLQAQIREREGAAATSATVRQRHWEHQHAQVLSELDAERTARMVATEKLARMDAEFAALEQRQAEETR